MTALRAVPRITGRTRLFGLIGHPIRRSLSPEMHTALFAELGLDAVYLAFDVDPAQARRVPEAIRVLGLVGVNLTVPFKEAVLDELDDLTQAAEEAGAVNVVTNVDGFLTGYNTDGEGFVRALEARHGWLPRGRRCMVLGAGGTGRAVAASLAAGGAAEVVLCNRTRSRAERAAAWLSDRMPSVRFRTAGIGPADLARAAEGMELVANCLGGPGTHHAWDVPLDALAPDAVWVDVNYWMDDPPQLAACRERGLRTADGLGMLVHQGALSFELFTGHPIDPARLEARLVGGSV